MRYKMVPNTPLSAEEPRPEDFIFADKEPKPLNLEEVKKMIGYPKEAKDHQIEGNIVMRILVDKKGDSTRYISVKKLHPLLLEAVEEHVFSLKFSPAIKDGEPILFWINISFWFKA